ncbi:hypothetical protein Ddc_05918 [Ditylenchus destructor]|nr:hypothetical protein Ddc_05918 [Ditylenchus destructor]
MTVERQKHVRFGSPLFASRKISTPILSPTSSAVSPLQPSLESATFRYLFQDYPQVETKRSLSLDSFLVLTTRIQPPEAVKNTNEYDELTAQCPSGKPFLSLATRIFHALLAGRPNPSMNPARGLTHSWSYQEQDGPWVDTAGPSECGPPAAHNPSRESNPIPRPSLFVMGRRGRVQGDALAKPFLASHSRPQSITSTSVIKSEQQEIDCSAAKRNSNSLGSSISCSVKAVDPALTDQFPLHQTTQLCDTKKLTSPFEKRRGLDFSTSKLLSLNAPWSKGLKSRIKSARHSHSPDNRKRIPASHTFPITRKMDDFDEDFVPRSYTLSHPENGSTGSPSKEKIEIRRMSLKEFSGLDGQDIAPILEATKNHHSSSHASPLVSRLHHTSLTSNVGSLLDKFSSNRRRSSAGLNKLSSWNNSHGSPVKSAFSGENLYDSFDIAIEGINLAISEATLNDDDRPNLANAKLCSPNKEDRKPQIISGNVVFEQATQRLKAMKERLNSTMKNIPNESPKKVENLKNDKVSMLNETRLLVGACKLMVRSTSLPINDNEFFPLIQNTVESADRVTKIAEVMLRKRNSLFQAQLLTAKVDQVLKALQETISDLEASYGAPRYGRESKQLIRTSTTLAATLTQLIQAVQHL